MTRPSAGSIAAGARDARDDPTRTDERFALKLVGAGLVALVVHLAYAFALRPEVAGDAPFYRAVAKLFADGQGFVAPFSEALGTSEPTAQHPPLFVVYLAFWSKLGVDSIRGHQVVCCLLGALTAVLLGLLGRRLAGPRVGLLAALLVAVYPWFFMVERTVNSEALYFPLVVLALLVAYALLDRATVWRAAQLGTVIGLAALTRTDGVFLLVFLAAPVLWRAGPPRVAALAACFGAAALVLSPWVVRNAVAFDAFPVLSNNGGVTALVANCDATYYGPRLGFNAEACEQNSPCARLDEVPRSRCQQRAASAYVRRHLSRVPVVVLARVERTWELYRPRDHLNYGAFLWGRPRRVGQAALVAYVVILALALAGAHLLRRRKVPLLPLVALAAQVSFVSALALGESRFRAAAEPALVVLAAVALERLLRPLVARRRADGATTSPAPAT